jgi:hypothetical protein
MCQFALLDVKDTPAVPQRKPSMDYIKLSFRGGGQLPFFTRLQEALRDRAWEVICRDCRSL